MWESLQIKVRYDFIFISYEILRQLLNFSIPRFLILKTEIVIVLFANGVAIEIKWINLGKIPFWKYLT